MLCAAKTAGIGACLVKQRWRVIDAKRRARARERSELAIDDNGDGVKGGDGGGWLGWYGLSIRIGWTVAGWQQEGEETGQQ